MFERYTESARRTLFFARYACSQLGSITIEPEHLLLGLLREPKGVVGAVLAQLDCPIPSLRKEIERRPTLREKVPTSVEIPFAAAVKDVLNHAAAEADALGHNYIGTEHLLLGMLRHEATSPSVLSAHGLRLADARATVVKVLHEHAGERFAAQGQISPGTEQIDAIRDLVRQLGALKGGDDARALTERIMKALDALHRPPPP